MRTRSKGGEVLLREFFLKRSYLFINEEGIFMSNNLREKAREVEERLHHMDLTHLNTLVFGESIVVFSEYRGERENRCRFTDIMGERFSLSMVGHSGTWEKTPLTGTLEELLNLVTGELGWVLEDF